MNSAQISLFDGPALRDAGIQQAIVHADAVIEDWSVRALALLDAYPGNLFMVEEVRQWAYAQGFEKPPSERAWGGVISKASKLGLVMHNGYQSVSNPKAHATPASCWRKTGSLKQVQE